jgi:hypothetical protein
MSVLFYRSRRVRVRRRRPVYPFQFQQSGLVAGRLRTWFKKRKPLRTIAQKKKLLYPIQGVVIPPVGYVAYRKPRRPKIKRAKVIPFKLRAAKRLYIIPAQPAKFIAYKKPPRAKIRRGKSNIRTRAKFRYVIPAVIVPGTGNQQLRSLRLALRLGI